MPGRCRRGMCSSPVGSWPITIGRPAPISPRGPGPPRKGDRRRRAPPSLPPTSRGWARRWRRCWATLRRPGRGSAPAGRSARRRPAGIAGSMRRASSPTQDPSKSTACRERFEALMELIRDLAELPGDLAVVLPEEGEIGGIELSQRGKTVRLDRPWAAEATGAELGDVPVAESEIREAFGAALAAQPKPPATYEIYFDPARPASPIRPSRRSCASSRTCGRAARPRSSSPAMPMPPVPATSTAPCRAAGPRRCGRPCLTSCAARKARHSRSPPAARATPPSTRPRWSGATAGWSCLSAEA